MKYFTFSPKNDFSKSEMPSKAFKPTNQILQNRKQLFYISFLMHLRNISLGLCTGEKGKSFCPVSIIHIYIFLFFFFGKCWEQRSNRKAVALRYYLSRHQVKHKLISFRTKVIRKQYLATIAFSHPVAFFQCC